MCPFSSQVMSTWLSSFLNQLGKKPTPHPSLNYIQILESSLESFFRCGIESCFLSSNILTVKAYVLNKFSKCDFTWVIAINFGCARVTQASKDQLCLTSFLSANPVSVIGPGDHLTWLLILPILFTNTFFSKNTTLPLLGYIEIICRERGGHIYILYLLFPVYLASPPAQKLCLVKPTSVI